MKYFPRLRVFKASNVVLSLDHYLAYSYGWWHFLDRLPNGERVFNTFNYSNTTNRHQSKVRRVLAENECSPEYFIRCPKGLGDPMSGVLWNREQAFNLIIETKRKGTRKTTNARRLEMAQAHLEEALLIERLYGFETPQAFLPFVKDVELFDEMACEELTKLSA